MALSSREVADLFRGWKATQQVMLKDLRFMAGSTESDFLRIGRKLQDVYLHTLTLNETATGLVDTATGAGMVSILSRFSSIIEKMVTYLHEMENAAGRSAKVLHVMQDLLKNIAGPLGGFKRMSKHLYMFEVSIKIESACLGDIGADFINLALDIGKLAQQIKDKAGDLHEHQSQLDVLTQENLQRLESALTLQAEELNETLGHMRKSVDNLQQATGHFGEMGEHVAGMASENSEYLSNIVQSMQFHDIFRQQVEHVIEGLEELGGSPQGDLRHMTASEEASAGERESLGRIGDICELQEAQLFHASTAFCKAVQSIVDNMADIAERQKVLVKTMFQNLRRTSPKGGSFIDEVQHYMVSSAALLEECSRHNSVIAQTMHRATSTVEEMTEYVGVIEEIGTEIISVSLNARIKAAGSGENGGALSVLAEEIGTLSNDAVLQTETIAKNLTDIKKSAESLAQDVNDLETNLTEQLLGLKQEADEILHALDRMGGDLQSQVNQVQKESDEMVQMATEICSQLHIHQQVEKSATEIVQHLHDIHTTARRHEPAGAAFKEELRRMAESYTMESERQVHAAISDRHGIVKKEGKKEQKVSEDTEFGDNVDLF